MSEYYMNIKLLPLVTPVATVLPQFPFSNLDPIRWNVL